MGKQVGSLLLSSYSWRAGILYRYNILLTGLAKRSNTFLILGLQEIVSEFERISKVKLLKKWDSCVTHIIASTDENGACKRTIKYLMGILEGKWILNVNC